MGYCIYQTKSEFVIKQHNVANALKAIKKLSPDEGSGGVIYPDGYHRSHFAWVNNENYKNAASLKDAMEQWRWSIEENPSTKNIWKITFKGQKLGDDLILFKAIAPYVERGSFINMYGEDGASWQWYFDRDTAIEKAGKVAHE